MFIYFFGRKFCKFSVLLAPNIMIGPTIHAIASGVILNSNFLRENIPLKVIYHPLYSMNKFVTNKSKLPQDGAQVFPFMG